MVQDQSSPINATDPFLELHVPDESLRDICKKLNKVQYVINGS